MNTLLQDEISPSQISAENWNNMRAEIPETLHRCYDAWVEHGPGTTLEIAKRSGIPLLTLRPRTTNLFQAGYLRAIGRRDKCAVYRVR